MTRHKAYRFRIYPNQEQLVLLKKTFGCVRFVYNHYLSVRKEVYETRRENFSYGMCARDLVSLKGENPFLKEVDSIALQQSLRHLDTAFCNFFRKKESGYPRYKTKRDHHYSYTTVCVNQNIRLEGGKLVLPKLKAVKIRQHREIPAGYTLKSATISQSASGKCYASLLYEYEAEEIPKKKPEKVLGLDYSMKSLFVASSPEEIRTEEKFLHCYRKTEERLARAGRRLSHCKKGSRRYQKQRKKLALLYEKTADQRADYLHKKSRQIANAWDAVCVEDLDLKAMSGTLHFGKSIHDNGWGMFRNFLSYKLEEQGKQLAVIDRWYPSSKRCHVCGHIHEGLKLSDRSWVCEKCGAEHDRDENAGINIREEGLRLLGA